MFDPEGKTIAPHVSSGPPLKTQKINPAIKPSLHEDKNLIKLTEQKQWRKILGNI